MALAAKSIQAFPNAAGNVTTVKSEASPDVVWATVQDWLNQPNGTSFSEDVRLLLSGAGSATAVITIVDISGDTQTTLGLSIQNDDDLETAAGTNGAGVFRLKATYNSTEYLSNAFSFSVVTPAPPDVLAPTDALIFSLDPVSASQIDLVILPPCDPKSPTSDADGMDDVEIHRSTNGVDFSLLTTKSISAGLSLQLEDEVVGTVSPTPSAVQDGADWTLTAAGENGQTSTADDLLLVGADVVDDFIATCKVPQWSAILTGFPTASLMARESTAVGSKYWGVSRLANASSAGVPSFIESKYRPTTDASSQFTAAITGVTGDAWLMIRRVGDVFTAYYFQDGFSGWTLLNTQTISMTSQLRVGVAFSTRLASTEDTAVFEEVCIQNLALITHSDSGLDDNTTYYYKARGIDI